MLKILMAVLAAVPMMGSPHPAAHDGACAGLTAVPGVTSAVVAPTNKHAYCEVHGVLQPRTRFTLKLPVEGWTGQYVQQGCSALCGAVPDLIVPLFGFRCQAALDGRLALGATDSGHTGSTIGDASWGGDPVARIEFGLTSEHRLNQLATVVLRAYYGRAPAHRYYDGCSTGGRQALNLAQRFPADFDGILAGAPAADLTGLSGMYNPWLVLNNTDDQGRDILTADKLPVLHAAVVKACGDPVPDPRRCGFQPSSIRCRGSAGPDCLTSAQVRAVEAIYRGPGRRLYSGGAPKGSELGWAGTFVGSDLTRQFALGYYRYLAYPKNPPADFSLADVKFSRAALAKLNVLGNTIYNATNPDLSAFRAHGGKLILYHGWADSQIPPFATVDYYAAVERRVGGYAAAQKFSRLYMVPGGYHCLITATELVFVEMLQPLMDWVERGAAPGTLSAPVLSYPDYGFIRDGEVKPFDALVPAL